MVDPRTTGFEPVTRAGRSAIGPRAGGPSGPGVLAVALRRLSRARAANGNGGRELAVALGEVASAAVRWRDRL